MKRDMEAVRSLLLRMEESSDHLFLLQELMNLTGEDDSQSAVGLVMMLKSGGYLETTPNGAYRMAWAGYEFLDNIRDPEIWKKTKAGATKVGSWSVKLLGELATGYLRVKAQELGLPVT